MGKLQGSPSLCVLHEFRASTLPVQEGHSKHSLLGRHQGAADSEEYLFVCSYWAAMCICQGSYFMTPSTLLEKTWKGLLATRKKVARKEHEAVSSPRSQVPFWFLRRFIFSYLPTPSLLSSFVKISLGLRVFYVFVLRDQEPVCKHIFQRAAISLALSRESFSRKSKRWRRQCFKCYCDFFCKVSCIPLRMSWRYWFLSFCISDYCFELSVPSHPCCLVFSFGISDWIQASTVRSVLYTTELC